MHKVSKDISGEECFHVMKEFSRELKNCEFWKRYFYGTSINMCISPNQEPDRFTLELRGAKILENRKWKEWGEIKLNLNLHFGKCRVINECFKIRMAETNLILKENFSNLDPNILKKIYLGYDGRIHRKPIHRFHNRCAFVPKLDEFAACVAVTMIRELLPYAKKVAQRKEKILNNIEIINYPRSRRSWWDLKTCHDFRGKYLPISSVLVDGIEFKIDEYENKMNTI